MKVEINYKETGKKKKTNMETKQYATKQPVGQRKNKEEILKISWDKQKHK